MNNGNGLIIYGWFAITTMNDGRWIFYRLLMDDGLFTDGSTTITLPDGDDSDWFNGTQQWDEINYDGLFLKILP